MINGVEYCAIHQHYSPCEHNTNLDPAEAEHYKGALGWRNLDDGRVIVLYNMIYNVRVVIGPQMAMAFDSGWCYPKEHMAIAVIALQTWDGAGDPPDGWIKQAGTGRRRPGGDPNAEYVET